MYETMFTFPQPAKGEPEATKPPPKTEEDDCIGLSCMEKGGWGNGEIEG